MDVKLVLLKSDGSHKSFHLSNGVTTIGRRHRCDLCIPLMSVSRKHCQLNCDEGALKIRDLGSRNGTCLNGKRVINEAVIKAGDSIGIGPLTFIIQIDGQPQTIAAPVSSAQSASPQDTSADDIVDEQLDDFAVLGDLDSLKEIEPA